MILTPSCNIHGYRFEGRCILPLQMDDEGTSEIGEVSCPVHGEWGTVGSNPVFVGAGAVRFPQRAGFFGIGDMHDFHHRNPLDVNKLVQK